MNVALRPEHLNILSICTGGGGLDLGVELAIPGARSVCMVEREAFAVAQLVSAMEAGLMAPAPIWSDARTFDGRAWRGAVDGLIGGIPCQPHSLAGKRLGEEDERDLWSTARRIIVQSGAWFVLIENVRGMLSSGGAERVWRDLQRLGFKAEGGLFTASEVGASHERERFFILAVADDAGRTRSNVSAEGGSGEPKWQTGGRSRQLAHAISAGLERCDRREIRDQQPPVERGGKDLDNSISVGRHPRRDDHGEYERYELSSAGQHPLVDAESIGRREGRPEPELRSWGRSAASASEPVGNADILELRREPPAGEQPELQHQHGFGARYLFPPGPSDLSGWRGTLERAPELEPAFRRMADGLASGVDLAQCWSRVDRLRQLGNGVVPLEAAYAVRTLATRLAARGSAGAARLVRMTQEIAA